MRNAGEASMAFFNFDINKINNCQWNNAGATYSSTGRNGRNGTHARERKRKVDTLDSMQSERNRDGGPSLGADEFQIYSISVCTRTFVRRVAVLSPHCPRFDYPP
jgi:hypothetical protein